MDHRAAALGLVLLAALAWALPRALRAANRLLRQDKIVVYAEEGSERLVWSPARAVRDGGGFDGQVVGAGGVPRAPVGGWTGLLLGNPLDLNTATQIDLEALPGVGPKTAAAILEERARRGGYRSVTELLEVRGIGPATLERLRTLVRVEGPASPPLFGRAPIAPGGDGHLE
jgi:competence ComEA-like helix-hairpin-helix protein